MNGTKKVFYGLMSLFVVAMLVGIDQYTKFLAASKLPGSPFVLINGVFELRYLENRGSAFGMLQNQRVFLLMIGILVLCLAILYFFKLPWTKKMAGLRVLMVFIAAGGIGNMIDRMRLGYVVDFFYFKLIDFPIFNVADIYVTVSVIVFFVIMLFFFDEKEMAAFSIFSKKKGKDE
ncbi:MAG: signal peptidase II [Lachnospiraceae bacterium]|nr:signal peptidase II [Lachnospiraceae bacterium]